MIQISGSFARWVPVVPSDSIDFPEVPDALYVGGAGNIVAVALTGESDTIAAIAGAILPIRPKRINSSSTTATGMYALYYT